MDIVQPNSGGATLRFSSIDDLILKTDMLKAAHKIQSEALKDMLRQNHVEFTEYGDYIVVVDIGKISDEKRNAIKQWCDTQSLIDSVYNELVVVRD